MRGSSIDHLLQKSDQVVQQLGLVGVIADTLLKRSFPSVAVEAQDCDCPSRQYDCESGCEPYGEVHARDFEQCIVDGDETWCAYGPEYGTGICC